VTSRRVVKAGLIGLLIGISVSACGGGNSSLYDASATYGCLTEKPEYQGTTITGSATGFTFTDAVRHPLRFGRHATGLDKTAGPGFRMTVVFYNAVYSTVQIYIFDTAAGARSTYRLQLRMGRLPEVLRQTSRLERNLFINWGARKNDDPDEPRVRSIILGCLRTR
jgi:hypothetical protein